MEDVAKTLREQFACRACGVVHPFRRVTDGVQQDTCPDAPVMLPDRTPARGPYLHLTDRDGVWLVWSRGADGKLDISALELAAASIPMADESVDKER